jgi:phage baseplate assembly protein W
MDWSAAMKAISYPFTLDTRGAVLSTSFSPKIYLDRVLTLLSTNIGQRPTRPDYGVDLSAAFFENEYIYNGGDVTTYKKAVEQAIRVAVANWLPDITIDEITITNPDIEGFARITILIGVPGNLQLTLNTTTAIFGADGTITRTS